MQRLKNRKSVPRYNFVPNVTKSLGNQKNLKSEMNNTSDIGHRTNHPTTNNRLTK